MARASQLERLGRFVGAGAAAGLLLAASLPPLGWWPLAVAGVAVLALLLGTPHVATRWRLCGCAATAVGFYGPSLWWATEFHTAGWVALVLLEAAILVLVLLAVPPARVAAGLPAALVLVEAIRGRWPFGGLPLAGLDLGQAAGPLLPVARLGGHLLVVAALGAAGVGLAELVRGRIVAAGAWIGAVAVVAGAGWIAFDGSPRGVITAAAVQGGGPRGVRAVVADPAETFEAHVAASAQVPAGTALVLWPEDVVDVSALLAGSSEEAGIAALARSLGTTLVAGVVEDAPAQDRFRNAAVAWNPGGVVVDRYEKVQRVPFGEYVPWRGLFGRVADLSNVPRDAVPGRGPGVLDTPAGRLGVMISYEVFFSARARAAASAGGRVLLIPTNASSYTTAQVPSQELAAARMRAVETGRWAVQAAPTGYSAVVDQRGRVRARGPLGDRAVLVSSVELRAGRTLATVLGDLPVVLGAILAGALAWASKKPERLTIKFPGWYKRART